MPSVHETAYPRLKSSFSPAELAEIFTPKTDELRLAVSVATGRSARLAFLVMLKTFQRLGYFVPLASVPTTIVEHIGQATGLTPQADGFARYDVSGTRLRHATTIRRHLGITAPGPAARRVLVRAIGEAALTKNVLVDLINVGIEELVRRRFELPAFDTLDRTTRRIRATVARSTCQSVASVLGDEEKARIDAIFILNPATRHTLWNSLKVEPGAPTLSHLRELIARLSIVSVENVGVKALAFLPDAKLKHFAMEARTLDAGRMQALEPNKRYTLAAAFLAVQSSSATDDVVEMFIKRMSKIHKRSREALERYRQEHRQRTDALVSTLREIVVAYSGDGSADERMAAIEAVIGDRSEQVIEQCDAHAAHSGNNFFGFVWDYFNSHRTTLFHLLRVIRLRSTSQDRGLEEALRFVASWRRRKTEWIPVARLVPRLDLSWVSDPWWRLVTGKRNREAIPERINRRHFEACVFSQVLTELRSADIAVDGSDRYADYRDQLVSWDEYRETIEAYGELAGIPVRGDTFVSHARLSLASVARKTDRAFPHNEAVRIENGVPTIRKPDRRIVPENLRAFEEYIYVTLEPVNILDVLADTERWLGWTRHFEPISGHEAKLPDAVARYIAAVFCYGCNLGPSQTARSLEAFDRRQVAWVNLRHISDEKLDRAIRDVINAYNRFALPKAWGTGERASADGTKWDLYEQNLLSEYHIRYGGYGGIGYYHVSDTYVALFCHFIPCGVWEAIYIIDGRLNNKSDIQPDVVQGHTQAQSTPVNGLAYPLGIRLMPRIRNWKDLIFFRPDKTVEYEHIDGLFSDTVNWKLIETHLPDMLRVALSIKAGRITASTLLRKLGTYSRKNRLYQAFRELGRAVRTGFLLEYLGEESLRATIQAATNKSEAFNGFTKWLAFGNDGTIAENNRDEQRKIIKYNHLVANCVIFYNVKALTELLADLQTQGRAPDQETLALISPYLTQHINRFGRYSLNLDRTSTAPDCEAPADTIRARKPDRTAPKRLQMGLWPSRSS